MSQAAHPPVTALWDLHHPYWQGELPAESYNALAPFVRMAQVKDSLPPDQYCLLGEGDVPILDMLRLLDSSGYNGWVSLEWETRWCPHLADPSVAFPQYAAVLRSYLASL